MGTIRRGASVLAIVLTLSLVAALLPASGPSAAADLPFPDPHEITYTVPADYDTFVRWWQDLAILYPGYLEMWSPNQRYGLGQVPSSTGHPPYDLYMVRLTNESRGLQKPEVFFMGNPHGDERAGPIGAYWFAHWLLRHALSNAWNTPYDDWLNWILDHREVYFLVSHNPDGFDRVRRGDASGRDLNREADHDGPEPTSGWPDVFTSVQGRTVARFMGEHQVRVGMDFHGGIRALLYPWGSTRSTVVGTSPVTGRSWTYAPPDFAFFDVFGNRMGSYMGSYDGRFTPNPFSAGDVGTPFGIVGYVARGTYLNWGYGADTATNPVETPYVRYGPYRGSGALWYTPEISTDKNPLPSQYGGDLTMGFGIDVRRMLLAAIDVAQPYVRWHPSGAGDGARVQAGDFVTLAWQVNGSLVADATRVQWGTDPDPVGSPIGTTPLRTDYAGRYWGGTGWEGALDGATSGHVWTETVQMPMTPGTYYFVARAKVDQRYSQVLSPATYGPNPYLRIIKERAVPGWSETIVGADGPEQMAYREWWDSPVLRLEVVADATPPLVTLRSPAAGSVIRPGTILDFEIADASPVTATWDDGTGPRALPPPYDVDTTGWADGPVTVTITATDAYGTTTREAYPFVVDGTPPLLSLLSPPDGAVVVPGTIVDLEATDLHLTDVTWDDGSGARTLAAPYDLNTMGWADGPYGISARAVDDAGNEATLAFGLTIDGTPPAVSRLDAGTIVAPGYRLRFAVADPNLEAVTWSDGGAAQPLAPPYEVDTAGWADGAYTVVVQAGDRAGNAASASGAVTVDGTPPAVVAVAPTGDTLARPGLAIRFSVTDAHLAGVEVLVNGEPTAFPAPFVLDTTGWADGPYEIRVSATDAAGNLGSATLRVEIDGTPPVLGTPQAEAPRVGTLVTVRVAATDAHGPARVTLHWRVPGGTFAEIPMVAEGEGTYVATIPAPASEGILEVYVSAEDDLGNEARTAVVELRVTASLASLLVSPFLWLAILVAVLAAAILLLARRRRRSPGAERPAGSARGERVLGEQREEQQDE